MADFGVLPTGFSRKSLSTILQEIETANITEFGPDVIQSAESPLGQINGLFADLVAELWELAEDVYQAHDVDQAEGARLDIMAKLRLVKRQSGESDESLRLAVTNQQQARIDIQDIARAVKVVDGVTFVKVHINDTPDYDPVTGMNPGEVAVAILGGDDETIAQQLRRFIAPGISLRGNTWVSSVIDGYCRSIGIMRPREVPVALTLRVRLSRDRYGCPPPSPLAIRDALFVMLQSETTRLGNGDNVDHFRLRTLIEGKWPNVELLSFTGERDENGYFETYSVPIAFDEIAYFDADKITVDAV